MDGDGDARPCGRRGRLRHEITALLPDLRAFARFLVRGRAEADDLVQDTLVRALGALGQFQPGTNLKAWLFTILRNAFYEQLRRRKREQRALEAQFAEAESAAGASGEPGGDRATSPRLLWRLPPLLREALVLVGAQELSLRGGGGDLRRAGRHDEGARLAGPRPACPARARRSRRGRGRARLNSGPARPEPKRHGGRWGAAWLSSRAVHGRWRSRSRERAA